MTNTEIFKALLGANYKDGMTSDEIINAIGELKTNPLEVATNEVTKLKARISEVNAESANWKKQLRAKQTEEEQKKAEQEEKFNQMATELENLKQEKQVAETKAKFAAAGFGEDSENIAKAFLSGDVDSAVSFINTRSKNQEDALKAELLKGTPRPVAGNAGGEKMTKDKLFKMSFEDRMKFVREHKAEYDEIMKD